MPMNTKMAPSHDGARHHGPPLVALAVVYAALSLASLAVAGQLSHGGHIPSPFGSPAASFDFFARYPLAVRWGAFLQLGAAVPLGLFAATAASRLHFLGVRAAGVSIALFGGIAASAFLAISAAMLWALSWPEVLESQATVHALHLVAFAAGGPAHIEALGLLLAGAAVTGGLHRLLPRWVMASGLVLAAMAELGWLALVLPWASYLLPIVRFGALAWLIAAGALIPRRRQGARASAPPPRAAVAAPAGFAAQEGHA